LRKMKLGGYWTKTMMTVACLMLGCLTLSAAAKTLGNSNMKTFSNPILSGFHPDPSICRVGDDFYLVNSTFEFFPGLPIYHSRDLVHWEQIGNALDRPSQLPLKGATDNGGLYAPTIRYWKGTFYLTCTNVSGGGNFVVKAKNPAGPWSEPIYMSDYNIDGSIFFDDDGKAYFTQHGGGEKAGIKQAEFDPETCQFKTTPKVIHNDLTESWNEGPHLYKIKGKYYLMLAEGGTGTQHMEWIGRSDNPWGPFEPCPFNPILTERDDPQSSIQCTGHVDLFEAPDGTWWMVFLGVRPQDGTSVLGRETFLAPVEWKDGWPVVHGDHHVAMEMEAPKLKPHPFPTPGPQWGFESAKLGPEWIHVRNPNPADLSLKRRKGFLSLRADEASISNKKENPSFAGQRQPDFKFTSRCAMDFSPASDGEEAGLMVRANDNNHYEVAVGRWGGSTWVLVRNRVGGVEGIVARKPFKGGRIYLELSGRETQYQFAWSVDGKTWETLAASEAADLSKERAGGFTGAAVGMYATANGRASDTWADFDWFEMTKGVAPKPLGLTPRPTPTPIPSREVWRIRCGGESWKDSTGDEWIGDTCAVGGETALTDRPIAGKGDTTLFQTERWGGDFSYLLPVPQGKYRVTLHFAETFVKNPGERLFDCMINNKLVLKDFDILKVAGGPDRGIEKSFDGITPDSQGFIRVRFLARVQNAKVCAIEVLKK